MLLKFVIALKNNFTLLVMLIYYYLYYYNIFHNIFMSLPYNLPPLFLPLYTSSIINFSNLISLLLISLIIKYI
jgi:hypothetical protein